MPPRADLQGCSAAARAHAVCNAIAVLRLGRIPDAYPHPGQVLRTILPCPAGAIGQIAVAQWHLVLPPLAA